MFLALLLEKFRRWRRSRETMRELSHLSDRELQDVGITRFDIPFIAKGDFRARH